MELDTQGDGSAPAGTEADKAGDADPKAATASGASTDGATGSTSPSPGSSATSVKEPAETEHQRARRAAEGERDTLRAELDRMRGEVDGVKPYRDLEALARDNPGQWVSEMAAAMSVTPQRVIEMLTKQGTGEKAGLTVEEKMAALERKIADREAKELEREKTQHQEQQAATRRANIGATATFIKNSIKEFPACEADGQEAAEAVYDVVEARYAALPEDRRPRDQAGLKKLYSEAAQKVESAIRARVERAAEKLGWKRAAPAAAEKKEDGFRGLLLSDTGTAAPAAAAADTVRTPDEIEAWIQRMGN